MDAALQKILTNNGLDILPDTTQWINRFEIHSSSSNRVYVVAQRANKTEWGCSCPGWRIHRSCKHLKSIMPLIEEFTRQTKNTKAIINGKA